MRILFYILIFLFSSTLHGQTFTKLSIKFGPTISGQKKTPSLFADGGIKYGLSLTVEPTIFTFGSKKQFDLNTDISFIQKGGMNYSPVITNAGTGSETYPVTINYVSFSPTLKFIFWKIMFAKAGPRIDAFVNFKKQDRFSSDPRTSKDFNTVTIGSTYGLGICTGKNRLNLSLNLLDKMIFQIHHTTKHQDKNSKTFVS